MPADQPQQSSRWYLKVAGDAVYGPIELTTLRNWATQGRVVATTMVSQDKQNWLSASSIPELEMTWTARLIDGGVYGPFNLLVVPYLMKRGKLCLKDVVTNGISGKTMFVSELLETGMTVPSVLSTGKAVHEEKSLIPAAGDPDRTHTAGNLTLRIPKTDVGKTAPGRPADAGPAFAREPQTVIVPPRVATTSDAVNEKSAAHAQNELQGLRLAGEEAIRDLARQKALHEAFEKECSLREENLRAQLELFRRQILEATGRLEKVSDELEKERTLNREQAVRLTEGRAAEETASQRAADLERELGRVSTLRVKEGAEAASKVEMLTKRLKTLEEEKMRRETELTSRIDALTAESSAIVGQLEAALEHRGVDGQEVSRLKTLIDESGRQFDEEKRHHGEIEDELRRREAELTGLVNALREESTVIAGRLEGSRSDLRREKASLRKSERERKNLEEAITVTKGQIRRMAEAEALLKSEVEALNARSEERGGIVEKEVEHLRSLVAEANSKLAVQKQEYVELELRFKKREAELADRIGSAVAEYESVAGRLEEAESRLEQQQDAHANETLAGQRKEEKLTARVVELEKQLTRSDEFVADNAQALEQERVKLLKAVKRGDDLEEQMTTVAAGLQSSIAQLQRQVQDSSDEAGRQTDERRRIENTLHEMEAEIVSREAALAGLKNELAVAQVEQVNCMKEAEARIKTLEDLIDNSGSELTKEQQRREELEERFSVLEAELSGSLEEARGQVRQQQELRENEAVSARRQEEMLAGRVAELEKQLERAEGVAAETTQLREEERSSLLESVSRGVERESQLRSEVLVLQKRVAELQLQVARSHDEADRQTVETARLDGNLRSKEIELGSRIEELQTLVVVQGEETTRLRNELENREAAMAELRQGFASAQDNHAAEMKEAGARICALEGRIEVIQEASRETTCQLDMSQAELQKARVLLGESEAERRRLELPGVATTIKVAERAGVGPEALPVTGESGKYMEQKLTTEIEDLERWIKSIQLSSDRWKAFVDRQRADAVSYAQIQSEKEIAQLRRIEELEKKMATASETEEKARKLSVQCEDLTRELAEQRKKLIALDEAASMQKAKVDVQQSQPGGTEPQPKWYLKAEDGSIYGPVEFADLIQWAGDSRIGPGHWISMDRDTWIPAHTAPQLEMRWVIDPSCGVESGPIHVSFLKQLVSEGAVSPGTRIVDKKTGESATAADLLAR